MNDLAERVDDLFLILLYQLSEQFTVRSGMLDPLLQMQGLVTDLGGEDRGVPHQLIGRDAIDLRRLPSLFALSVLSALSTIDVVTAPEMYSHCNSFVSVRYRDRTVSRISSARVGAELRDSSPFV